MRFVTFYVATFVLILFASCDKKSTKDTVDQGGNTGVAPVSKNEVIFNISNVAGTEIMSLDDTWYLTENKDSIKFSTFNYYMSNFVFVKEDGSEYKVEDSYVLIKESEPESKTFSFKNLPSGSYTKLKLLIGVDSARNVSGAQTGALDPKHNMFWDWNTGYIMAMIEGRSPKSPMAENMVQFHLGGFSGSSNVLRTVELTLPSTIVLDANTTKTIEMQADAMEWFKTPLTVDLEKLTKSVLNGGSINVLADNYVDMFKVIEVR